MVVEFRRHTLLPLDDCLYALQASIPHLTRQRNLVERFFSKLKHFRRIATRYDKLAENFLAMVKLASMRMWLRAYEFTA